MSNHTLYLVQSNYANTENAFAKIAEMIAAEDSLVLLGDSVLLSHSLLLSKTQNIYVLENDAVNIPKLDLSDLQIINYTQFAELVLKFKRCISLK